MEREKLIERASQIFEITAHYNKWLKELTESEKELVIDMLIDASLTTPHHDVVKEEEMELAGLKLQNKIGDRIVTFNYTFVAGAKWMQDKLNEK